MRIQVYGQDEDLTFSEHDISPYVFLGFEGFVYDSNEGSMKIQEYG